MPAGWTRAADSSGQAILRIEIVDPLVTVLLIEAHEASRQSARFALMYDSLPMTEDKDVLAYVRKMREHWRAREGAYLTLADSVAGRRYPLSDIRRAEAEALVRKAERSILRREQDGEERTEQGSEGAPQSD